MKVKLYLIEIAALDQLNLHVCCCTFPKALDIQYICWHFWQESFKALVVQSEVLMKASNHWGRSFTVRSIWNRKKSETWINGEELSALIFRLLRNTYAHDLSSEFIQIQDFITIKSYYFQSVTNSVRLTTTITKTDCRLWRVKSLTKYCVQKLW